MCRGRHWEQACSASVLPPKSPSVQTAQFFPRHCPICTAHGYSWGKEAKVLISHHMVTMKYPDQGSGKSQSLVITAPLHRSLKVGRAGDLVFYFFHSPQEHKLTLQPFSPLRNGSINQTQAGGCWAQHIPFQGKSANSTLSSDFLSRGSGRGEQGQICTDTLRCFRG